MSRIGTLRKLIIEDFKQDQQDLVDKIAYVLNPAIDQIAGVINGGVDFSNLSFQTKDLTLTVDSSGSPTDTTSFKSTIIGRVRGIQCVRAENLTNTDVYPTGCPFVSFSESAGSIIINNITNLQTDNSYKISLIIFPS